MKSNYVYYIIVIFWYGLWFFKVKYKRNFLSFYFRSVLDWVRKLELERMEDGLGLDIGGGCREIFLLLICFEYRGIILGNERKIMFYVF